MNDTLVLCYHAVSDAWDHPMAIGVEQLRTHVRMLRDRGYRFDTLTRAVTQEPRGRTAVVTFDDAFLSVLRRGLPVLSELAVPATVFVPTYHVDARAALCWPGFEDPAGAPGQEELTPLSWSQVRELRDAGWEVGSHTCTHPRLPGLDQTALERELRDSKNRCEQEVQHLCTAIAYPFGEVDARVARIASAVGYATGATLLRQTRDDDPMGVPRICVNRVDTSWRFAAKVARPARTPAAGRAVDAAHRLRARRSPRRSGVQVGSVQR